MKSKNYSLITAVFFLLIICSTFQVQSSEYTAPLIGEDDLYEKNASIETSIIFNWTVYKNSSFNYVVTVEVKGFGSWSKQVSPSYFIIDEENPHEIVGLKVTVPQFPERNEREGLILFTFRPLNGTDKTTITKHAAVHVLGIVSEEEENSIFGLFRNPLPEPLDNPLGAFILSVILWTFIAFGLYYFIKLVLIEVAKKTKTMLDDNIIQIIRTPFLFIIILFGACQSIFKLNLSLGLQVSINQLSLFIYVVVGVYMIYRVFDEVLEEVTIKKGGNTSLFGSVLRPVFRKIGITVIIIGGLIFGLSVIGIEVTALLAGAGVLGLVIAFAAQDTLSNFFSGIHLLLDRPFKIGDVIYLETGEYCRVENVGMRSTKLYSIFDHELIILPNNAVANQKIINIVKPDKKIRKKIQVGVAYGSDLKKVSQILYDATMSHPNIVKDKGFEPQVRLANFGESSLDFTINLWIDEVMNQWRVLGDIRAEIDTRFRKDHIEIPFPQRTVWLKSMDADKKKKEEVE
jgi:MscS family membrane protein